MGFYDVAIVGGGPAGSSCAGFCAAAGLHAILIEREKFPREKVCGDCLNPECWPILRRLGIDGRVRAAPHAALDWVEFVSLRDHHVRLDLPCDENGEIAIKRSVFDSIVLDRARGLGTEVREATTFTAIEENSGNWKLTFGDNAQIRARILVAADGRNSTVARLLGILPRLRKERIALQAHIPLPPSFGNGVVLQLLPEGYSGQVAVNDRELNLCLVGKPKSIRELQSWATRTFNLSAAQQWRTITPLTRSPFPPAQRNLLFVGDAARVVEPFTGEGIFYALRSGELAAAAVRKMIAAVQPTDTGRIGPPGRADQSLRPEMEQYMREHAATYRGRLWINALARSAVVSPKLGSVFFEIARFQPSLLRRLTRKVVH
jgi:geranylgeranyl reductase family protein